MQRYNELGVEAASTEEDLSEAQIELETRQRQLAEAKAALEAVEQSAEQAQAVEAQYQGEVDEFTAAALRGAGIRRASTVLTSESPQDLLDQLSALNAMAGSHVEALRRMRAASEQTATARTQAVQAQQQARTATQAAEEALFTVRQRKDQLTEQIAQVRQALNALPTEEKASLNTVQDSASYAGPPGAANDALQAALSRRGSEYEWGATGPTEFDCSGLTSWAYNKAGVSIPRTSRQQYTIGKPVGIDELRPGDLIFFDDGSGNPSAIHHVGMFVGDGKMVDAPTEGQLVDVRSMEGDGHFIGARRIVT